MSGELHDQYVRELEDKVKAQALTIYRQNEQINTLINAVERLEFVKRLVESARDAGRGLETSTCAIGAFATIQVSE